MKKFPQIACIPPDATQLPNGAWVYPPRQYQPGFGRRLASKLKTTAHLLPIVVELPEPEELEAEQLKLELNHLQKS